MTSRAVCAALLLAVFGAQSAVAHHSFAMFEVSHTADVSGTVTTLEWMNPHVWLWVSVTDQNGAEVLYGFEAFSIGEMMRREGWTKSTVKPGDKVSVKYLPFKNGKSGGKLTIITLADGRTLKG